MNHILRRTARRRELQESSPSTATSLDVVGGGDGRGLGSLILKDEKEKHSGGWEWV